MNRYERKGESDAKRGITACDLDDPIARRHWARGHDRAVASGLGKLPRFGLICRRHAPAPQDTLL
jgi:hypothetical protein